MIRRPRSPQGFDVFRARQLQSGLKTLYRTLEGYGVPTFRGFVGVRFTPTSHDQDDDGITDGNEDTDHDGIAQPAPVAMASAFHSLAEGHCA